VQTRAIFSRSTIKDVSVNELSPDEQALLELPIFAGEWCSHNRRRSAPASCHVHATPPPAAPHHRPLKHHLSTLRARADPVEVSEVRKPRRAPAGGFLRPVAKGSAASPTCVGEDNGGTDNFISLLALSNLPTTPAALAEALEGTKALQDKFSPTTASRKSSNSPRKVRPDIFAALVLEVSPITCSTAPTGACRG
jgi:hypothetical protein